MHIGLWGISMITYDDFRKVDMRVGRVLEVKDFPGVRKPSYKLKIDFGSNIGIGTPVLKLQDTEKMS